MRALLALAALLLLVPPAAPGAGTTGRSWLDEVQALLHERGGDLGDIGTLTTLTPEGPVVRAVRGHDVAAALASALGAQAQSTVVPGTWGAGIDGVGGDAGWPGCSPVFLYAIVLGDPRAYYHATPSELDDLRTGPSACGGWWGATHAWKDITFDLRQGATVVACGGAVLLVEPSAGAAGPGTRCGWRLACFSGNAAVNFWGPGFGVHFLFALGQDGGIAMGGETLEPPTRPPLVTDRDAPCLPGSAPV